MLTVKVDTEKVRAEITKRLKAIKDSFDVEAVLDEATAALLNRQRDRFLKQVSPDNVPWIPSHSALMRELTGAGGGTLFRTGELFHSIQEHTVSYAYPGAAETFGERAISTDVPYGKSHQHGIPGKLPIRAFLGFNPEDEDLFEKIVKKRLNQVVKAYGTK